MMDWAVHTASKLWEQDATADSGDTGGECWLLIVNHKFLTMNGYQCCIHYLLTITIIGTLRKPH